MGDTENATEPQEEVVTVPKKPRTQAQLAALDAARKKAYAMRAEKSALKKNMKLLRQWQKLNLLV